MTFFDKIKNLYEMFFDRHFNARHFNELRYIFWHFHSVGSSLSKGKGGLMQAVCQRSKAVGISNVTFLKVKKSKLSR